MIELDASRSHQALLNSLSGVIARIYNSDELDSDLKHDIACRLIAKSIGANSVSILLYKGTLNQLYCAGRYIDPFYSNAKVDGTRSKFGVLYAMHHLDVLEYFSIRWGGDIADAGKLQLKELYREYCRFDFSNPIRASFGEFLSFWNEYKVKPNKKKIQESYLKYRSHIREDQHPITMEEPVTGAYYFALTHCSDSTELKHLLSKFPGITVGEDNIVVTDLARFSTRKICSDNLIKKLRVKVDTDALYVGVPLMANNRPIGMLRILLRRDLKFDVPASEDESVRGNVSNSEQGERDYERQQQKSEDYSFATNPEVMLYVRKIVRIQSFAVLLALFIENLFFTEGMRDISLKDSLKGEINSLPFIADELTKVVNCFGCVIRLSNSKSENASIIGHSKEVSGYVESINKGGDPYISKRGMFVPLLIDLLYQKTVNIAKGSTLRKQIECIKVDFDSSGSPNFSYLYLDLNSRLVVSNDWNGILNNKEKRDLVKIFTAVKSVFQRFDIRSIVQIPIRNQEHGMVTFANTSNRTFLTKDVEMLIPVVNRLGLALKYDTDIAKAELASKNEIQKSQWIIYHQVLSPIASLRNSIVNLQLLSSRKEYTSFDLRLEEVAYSLETAIDFITLNQYLSSFFIEKRIVPKYSHIYIPTFLINKARTYQVHAEYHRGIKKIHVYSPEYFPSVDVDKTLLTHIIQALLDNSIKYSYSHLRNAYSDVNNPLYAPSGRPNMILVSCNFSDTHFMISVENWGLKINDKELPHLTDYMKRGKEARNFEVNGTGIGLFLVNAITKAMNGELDIFSKDDHTKITIKLPRSYERKITFSR